MLISGLQCKPVRNKERAPLLTQVVSVPLPTDSAAMATVEAALPPGTVAWIGPAHVLDAIVPHARRSADAVLPVESAPSDAGALAAAIAGARAVVDARGDVWAAAAVLRAAPPTAAIMALLLPPHSLDSARITGWARTATIEERGRRVAALAIGAAAAASGGDAVGGACLAVAAADVAVTRAVLGDDGVVMVDRLQSGWSPLPRTPDTPWLLQPPCHPPRLSARGAAGGTTGRQTALPSHELPPATTTARPS